MGQYVLCTLGDLLAPGNGNLAVLFYLPHLGVYLILMRVQRVEKMSAVIFVVWIHIA